MTMTLDPIRNYNDVKILKVEQLYQGWSHVERYTLQTRTFKGDWTTPYTREVVTGRQASSALPYDPITNQVVLIEQFRAGALEFFKDSAWLLEVVAGLNDKAKTETMEEVIIREMREEAKLEILALLPISDYLVSPGLLTERVKLFCAKVDATKAPAFAGLATEHEDIRLHVIPVEEAFAAVRSGRINNSAAIISLQWLELNLAKVRQQWL
jgi:ADP-ribose pyrophosphatase